jgi:riboflavin kinase/FMN adenylyltransferase
MLIFESYTGLPTDARGAVVAIGNFDGVHPGHRAVLTRAAEVAEGLGAPFGLVTFEPHPRQYFQSGIPAFRLTPAPAKRRLIAAAGASLYYELRFDAAMAGLTAEAFVERVLLEGLGVRHIVVGGGFAFGKGRTGTVSVLEHVAGHKGGVGVTVVAPVAGPDGVLYSSSRARECLQRGEPERAAALLGRVWAIEGRVEEGDKRGRLLGFPTANMGLDDYLQPAFGVYAMHAYAIDDGAKRWRGVANLGSRPTVGGTRVLLEAHLFDFGGDLYGRTLAVELLAYIRPERKFESLDALKAQIAQDSTRARHLLAAGGRYHDRKRPRPS